MLSIFLGATMAYLLGSIPSGLWIGRKFFQIDIRQHGSGNLGATNSFRILGKKAGTIVLLMDLLKGSISVLLLKQMDLHGVSPLIIALFAVVGHTYPLFANFKGGKAVATFAGVILAYQPVLFLIGLGIFILTLAISKMVSFTSMLTISIGVLLSLYFQDMVLTTIALLADIFIIYRHRTNIQRILNGTEAKVDIFKWKK
ncbi:glycerol-3-phosphate 1-O-acyltransferase PlsY [Granulicatella elegans]|uniref:Glycerol-3-phosphate acyltransferase n=1 Tax=Granulicatella elegans ATCC 700633 TaxID=626369 RepID=D0BKA7_9LACT|nr:glycerol-3-phosphate 1-O-acyltransferase PlsY [Granulicatella elegans]EEW93510.1 acyl-phosphate glycerol 3-phosphate acyltransferase [Granulicatella elegans ATCC 700633]